MSAIALMQEKHRQLILDNALKIAEINLIDESTKERALGLIAESGIQNLLRINSSKSKFEICSLIETIEAVGVEKGVQEFIRSEDGIPSLVGCIIDISDVINYLAAGHKTVSGIQRLVIATLATVPKIDRINIALVSLHDYEKKGAISVDWCIVDLIVEFISGPHDPAAFLSRFNQILAESGSKDTVNFSLYSTLIIMGAAWIVPSFPKAHREMAKLNGLRVSSVLYDLIPYTYPDFVSADASREFYFYIVSLLSISDQLISISKYVSEDLKRNRISLGKGLVRFPQNLYVDLAREIPFQSFALREGDAVDVIRNELNNLGVRIENFVLNVGSVEIRKNHIGVFAAWRQLYAKLGEDCPQLVIVGRAGWKAESFFEALKCTNNLDGKILLLHGIDDTVLAGLYSLCKFTVYPSLEEGWGLPIGESLDAGKLCITSNRASMPEVGGELCLYVNPTDPLSIAEVVEEVLLSPHIREKIERAISLAKPLKSWREYQQGLAKVLMQSKSDGSRLIASMNANNFYVSYGQVISYYWHLGSDTYDMPEGLSGKRRSLDGLLPSRLITTSRIGPFEADGAWCLEPKFKVSFYLNFDQLRLNDAYSQFGLCLHFLLAGGAKNLEDAQFSARLTIFQPDISLEIGVDDFKLKTSQVLGVYEGHVSESSHDLALIKFDLPDDLGDVLQKNRLIDSVAEVDCVIYPIEVEFNWSSAFDFVCMAGRMLSCLKIKEIKIGC